MRRYFRDIYRTLRTILIGMRITLRYYYASPITVQYPDVAPVLAARFRGFHRFEIQKCIGCDLCAKACPIDCIYIEKSGPRKINKETSVAQGGALHRFAIDYAKCMFCALCIEPCPTECIHMGDLHDLSGYDRGGLVVEFTELAKRGLQTPVPPWMDRAGAPEWARQRRSAWESAAAPHLADMAEALTETKITKPAPKAKE